MSRYYVSEIRRALTDALTNNDKVILLGEDIRDPFGGCFKATQGISTKFPQRVINTPISEAAITGISTGLAIGGFIPIVEIMFYDFLPLAMDQILNHMSKFKSLWGIDINVTIRTVIGRTDYGVTHCQNLDYIFKDVIKIVHPMLTDDIYSMLYDSIFDNKPVLFVEEAILYKQRLVENV